MHTPVEPQRLSDQHPPRSRERHRIRRHAARIAAAMLASAALLAQGSAGGRTVHVACAASGPECGRALQEVLDAVPAGTTVTLEAGKVYEGSLTIRPRRDASPERRLTITTRGWSDTREGWDGLVTPADKPRMAVIRGSHGASSALEIVPGESSGFVAIVGVAFDATPPRGQGDLIRIGASRHRDPETMPRHVAVRQVLLQGSRDWGQKRGIAANGADIVLEQVWCEEIFTPGEDSQCVAAWNGGHRVRVRFAYLAAGAENILIGGAPVAAAAMQPADWLIEDVILHKPLRWQRDGRNRQVKNLLEFKHGRDLTVRRVLAVNTWRAAQDGRGLLVNYTTNGRCPDCGGLERILLEEVVMLNVEAGMSFQGHSWQPDSHSDGKVRDVTLRHVYLQFVGEGRLFLISNVHDRHDIRIERSTFVNDGVSWLMGAYGRAWRDDETLEAGGPMKGLWIVDNVIATNGRYGVTAPEGRHYGEGLGEFVEEDLQIAGNVLGDAPREHLGNYNRHRGVGAPNVSAPREQLLRRLGGPDCAEWAGGKGADCRRLTPVFALRDRLPEP